MKVVVARAVTSDAGRADLLVPNADDAVPMAATAAAAPVARALLDWSGPGDVMVLPVHTAAVRGRQVSWLSATKGR